MLADNIKTIRRNKGYSQEELAERIHVTRQTVSKWENGQSVPDADLLKAMAEVLGVSVSELIDGDAEKIIENEVIIDQLARINEQLIINNRRAKKRTRIIIAVCIAVVVLIASFVANRMIKERQEKGYRVTDYEHLGVLTYTMPDSLFYHAKDDVCITDAEDGRALISGKIYKNYDDMAEIWVTEWGAFNQEPTQDLINEFKKSYAEASDYFSGEHGQLPKETEFFIAATDGGTDEDGLYYAGTYYRAYIVLDGNLYEVIVKNGCDVLGCGELVISSMFIDKTLDEEYK